MCNEDVTKMAHNPVGDGPLMSVACPEDGDASWFTNYYQQDQLRRKNRRWRSSLHPSALVAVLVIVGRIVVGPLILLLLFIVTSYLSPGATFLITADSTFFTFTEHDLSMLGGCINCIGPCKISLLKYAMFNGNALLGARSFAVFAGQGPIESLYAFSSLTPEALALGESLDSGGAICSSGVTAWGSPSNTVTSTPQHVLDVITTMKLSVPPQTLRELELGIERAEECETRWTIIAIPRQFSYTTNSYDSPESGKISAVAVNVFPEYAECRPDVPINGGGSKLAVYGSYVLPAFLALFPYSFESSIPEVARVVPAMNTKYGASTVLQPFMHAYYGGCRVREVSASAIYVEDPCETWEYWEKYGLMIQYPDDIPLCTTTGVCVHNYYNSQWEWITEIVPEKENEPLIFVNTFQNRCADKVGISVLPGFVVMQIFVVGISKAYQVMAHSRSVLLTQIWAYHCQNGQMQVVYLAQIAYHLLINSDLYLLGFATGTLTTESIANLACCFYAFSYSFVNLAKSRAGDQQLDRYFRLTWETIHVVVTACVVAILRVVQRNPLESIISTNAQIFSKDLNTWSQVLQPQRRLHPVHAQHAHHRHDPVGCLGTRCNWLLIAGEETQPSSEGDRPISPSVNRGAWTLERHRPRSASTDKTQYGPRHQEEEKAANFTTGKSPSSRASHLLRGKLPGLTFQEALP